MRLPKKMSSLQDLIDYKTSRFFRDLDVGVDKLLDKLIDIMYKKAGYVDADRIMDDVYYELEWLGIDVMSGRSGRTRYGYLVPVDAAWEMFGETLDPFIQEMKKRQQRALPDDAKAYCIGIIKGLRCYEENSCSDFAKWVPDAPYEYINIVVEEWKKGNPPSEDIVEVTGIVNTLDAQ